MQLKSSILQSRTDKWDTTRACIDDNNDIWVAENKHESIMNSNIKIYTLRNHANPPPKREKKKARALFITPMV